MVMIGVCSQDTQHCARLCQLLSFWAATICMDSQIVVWDRLEELANAFEPGRYQILFLDMEDREASTLHMARELQTIDPACALVFLSGNTSVAIDTYELHPVGFLGKPVRQQQLEITMERCFAVWRTALHWITLPVNRTQQRLLLCDLIYAETEGRYCRLHCVSGEVQASCSLGELENMLPAEPFLRCQNSFIVNLRYVCRYRTGEFLVEGGVRVPIGRSCVRLVQSRYEEFIGQRAR